VTLYVTLGYVALRYVAELLYARRNTRALLERGAIEVGANQYPFFIVLHGAWLLSMALTIPPQRAPIWWLLGIFIALQIARIWVFASIGEYWTTRIITLPNTPLVRRGPYRFIKHPNYAIVIAEIVVLPLAFDAIWIALTFSLLNAALLTWRIRVENSALAIRQAER
jgi:methyltransferase